ncbi:MAG: bifunctional phosphopantothenoylcysteine decarboxylase/phosphopantothenate--cysteine ligase CoaBC [Roseibium sp.]|uniref:bifunctional phosphopantothenoylcysteine decarboxylase/phosphopantothenate--cysteine ligase CoaBC n=1 Tax=Roseibium sp. TaxID=1936156 RepID=UPI001B2C70A7|nr:bifunctional phosphopantothenoylcysteine decarboxylase/phosphopantothenate--cysteine ligase CoaBC [Roseibium sp.]MBO6895051.1 bifunctional phosphopantothenoylcysteine decarboxylase/phosphopantothenate--cysteine ligase CoaBC [Roseibium sp.]MBO6930508.1 bifunctional phosphopantothenoylcysteine decarboxylase/phosphopantothenate--cysteine ligase CoaBC [Roseibium sp.]
MLRGKDIVLIISGGIAAYKSLDLIRRLKERGARVVPVMTNGAQEFITPLAVGALSAEKVFTNLFDREAEHDVGHIRLARDHDLILVAPATANLMAKMAHGITDDLATAVLLATDKPVLAAPAMNPKMWLHEATQRNLETLTERGISFVGPASGEMAERNESGVGRMSEPLEIVAAAEAVLREEAIKAGSLPLANKHVLITSGPTHEPIDPVRFIANRSSGKQGHALARAAFEAGARVTLVSGPVDLPDLANITTIHVESAAAMMAAVEDNLPADIAIMAAAVADWRVASEGAQKIKKDGSGKPPALELTENPDILATIGHQKNLRPRLLIGFAAETQDLLKNARSKLERKNADWIIANDVSPETGVMGGDANTVRLVSQEGVEDWPQMDKAEVARKIIARAGDALNQT